MGNDLLLVLGVAIGLLAIPATISAFSSGRTPRIALILFVIGGGLVAWVVTNSPNTYSIETFPTLVIDVIGGMFR